MCYSALVEQNLKHLARLTKARVAIDQFQELFHRRAQGEDIKIAKALEGNFLAPELTAERRIAADIRAFQARQAKQWEAEL